jgi:hypothetical protein
VKKNKRYSNSEITIRLVGGIGNQLFGYAAGRYLSEKNSAMLSFDTSKVGKGFTSHRSSLLTLNVIESIWERNSLTRFIRGLIYDGLIYAYEKINLKSNLINNLFGLYISNKIGYDKNLSKIKSSRYLSGYFQSYKYLDQKSLTHDIRSLVKLKNPSNWYVETKSKIELEQPIMVHVRRGDYSKIEAFGMLSAQYFKEAVDEIRKVSGLRENPIWIFSDEIDEITKEFSEIKFENIVFVQEPEDSDPAETLLLMSMGAANIISNSTFSWWSAFLNDDKPVIAPSVWFRFTKDPEDLIPPNWILKESQWIN